MSSIVHDFCGFEVSSALFLGLSVDVATLRKGAQPTGALSASVGSLSCMRGAA